MRKLLVILFVLISVSLNATIYYCAPTTATPAGSDANAGTIAAPFFTLNKAWTVISAGDIIYMRGGIFYYPSQQQLETTSGTISDTIKVWAYPGEQPILTKDSPYTHPYFPRGLIWLRVDYTYWRDIEITGITQETAEVWSGFANYDGDHNKFERLNIHNNGLGLLIYGGSDNLVLNCDFHHNYDPETSYGNGNGLQVGYIDAGDENTIRGCRSWNNADDGFDLWNNDGNVIIDSCWSWMNGYREDGITTGGDGNGFKLGNTATNQSSNFLRTVTNCMAFDNRKAGLNQNLANCKMYLYNNIAYNNLCLDYGAGFYFPNYDLAHVFRNNISFDNETDWDGTHTNATIDHNSYNASWQSTGPVATNADFESVDTTGVSGARQAGGWLPVLTFLHLAEGSDMIDAGTYVGIPFQGDNPDIGAWEYVNPPVFTNKGFLKDKNNNFLKNKTGTIFMIINE